MNSPYTAEECGIQVSQSRGTCRLNLMDRERSGVSLRSKFNLAGWKDELLSELLSPI
jgi:hypothetical protein